MIRKILYGLGIIFFLGAAVASAASINAPVNSVISPKDIDAQTPGAQWLMFVPDSNAHGVQIFKANGTNPPEHFPSDNYQDSPEIETSLGGTPRGLAISPDGNYVFVSTTNPSQVRVYVASYAVGQPGTHVSDVVRPDDGLGDPRQLAVSPDGKRLYVVDASGKKVRIFDISNPSQVNSIIEIDTIEIGETDLFGIAISADNQYLAVTRALTLSNGGQMHLFKIVAQTDVHGAITGYNYNEVNNSPVALRFPTYVVFSPDSSQLYIRLNPANSTEDIYIANLPLSAGSQTITLPGAGAGDVDPENPYGEALTVSTTGHWVGSSWSGKPFIYATHYKNSDHKVHFYRVDLESNPQAVETGNATVSPKDSLMFTPDGSRVWITSSYNTSGILPARLFYCPYTGYDENGILNNAIPGVPAFTHPTTANNIATELSNYTGVADWTAASDDSSTVTYRIDYKDVSSNTWTPAPSVWQTYGLLSIPHDGSDSSLSRVLAGDKDYILRVQAFDSQWYGAYSYSAQFHMPKPIIESIQVETVMDDNDDTPEIYAPSNANHDVYISEKVRIIGKGFGDLSDADAAGSSPTYNVKINGKQLGDTSSTQSENTLDQGEIYNWGGTTADGKEFIEIVIPRKVEDGTSVKPSTTNATLTVTAFGQTSDPYNIKIKPFVKGLDPVQGPTGREIKVNVFGVGKTQDSYTVAVSFQKQDGTWSSPAQIASQGQGTGWSADYVNVTVPSSLTEGDRAVKVTINSADSNTNVTYKVASPHINSIEVDKISTRLDQQPPTEDHGAYEARNPAWAMIGDTIKIVGTNLGGDPGEGSRDALNTHVYIDGVVADHYIYSWGEDPNNRAQDIITLGIPSVLKDGTAMTAGTKTVKVTVGSDSNSINLIVHPKLQEVNIENNSKHDHPTGPDHNTLRVKGKGFGAASNWDGGSDYYKVMFRKGTTVKYGTIVSYTAGGENDYDSIKISLPDMDLGVWNVIVKANNLASNGETGYTTSFSYTATSSTDLNGDGQANDTYTYTDDNLLTYEIKAPKITKIEIDKNGDDSYLANTDTENYVTRSGNYAYVKSKIKITGENFGEDPGDTLRDEVASKITLGDIVVPDKTTGAFDDFVYSWKDNEIKLAVPRRSSDTGTYMDPGVKNLKVKRGQYENNPTADLSTVSIEPKIDNIDNTLTPAGPIGGQAVIYGYSFGADGHPLISQGSSSVRFFTTSAGQIDKWERALGPDDMDKITLRVPSVTLGAAPVIAKVNNVDSNHAKGVTYTVQTVNSPDVQNVYFKAPEATDFPVDPAPLPYETSATYWVKVDGYNFIDSGTTEAILKINGIQVTDDVFWAPSPGPSEKDSVTFGLPRTLNNAALMGNITVEIIKPVLGDVTTYKDSLGIKVKPNLKTIDPPVTNPGRNVKLNGILGGNVQNAQVELKNSAGQVTTLGPVNITAGQDENDDSLQITVPQNTAFGVYTVTVVIPGNLESNSQTLTVETPGNPQIGKIFVKYRDISSPADGVEDYEEQNWGYVKKWVELQPIDGASFGEDTAMTVAKLKFTYSSGAPIVIDLKQYPLVPGSGDQTSWGYDIDNDGAAEVYWSNNAIDFEVPYKVGSKYFTMGDIQIGLENQFGVGASNFTLRPYLSNQPPMFAKARDQVVLNGQFGGPNQIADVTFTYPDHLIAGGRRYVTLASSVNSAQQAGQDSDSLTFNVPAGLQSLQAGAIFASEKPASEYLDSNWVAPFTILPLGNPQIDSIWVEHEGDLVRHNRTDDPWCYIWDNIIFEGENLGNMGKVSIGFPPYADSDYIDLTVDENFWWEASGEKITVYVPPYLKDGLLSRHYIESAEALKVKLVRWDSTEIIKDVRINPYITFMPDRATQGDIVEIKGIGLGDGRNWNVQFDGGKPIVPASPSRRTVDGENVEESIKVELPYDPELAAGIHNVNMVDPAAALLISNTIAGFEVLQGAPNNAPNAFNLLSPANGAAKVSTLPAFKWQSNGDPDENAVTYTLVVRQNDQNGERAFTIRDLTEPQYTVLSNSGYDLLPDQLYWWTVTASDGQRHGQTEAAAPFTFTTGQAGDSPGDMVLDDFSGMYVTDPGDLPNPVNGIEPDDYWKNGTNLAVSRQSAHYFPDDLNGRQSLSVDAAQQNDNWGGYLTTPKNLTYHNAVSFRFLSVKDALLKVGLKDSGSSTTTYQTKTIRIKGSDVWQEKTVLLADVNQPSEPGSWQALDPAHIQLYQFVYDNAQQQRVPIYIDLIQGTNNTPPVLGEILSPSAVDPVFSPVVFDWNMALDPGDNPIAYTIEYADNQDFTNPRYAEVPAGVTQMQVNLSSGVYYWKLIATDARGLDSVSGPRRFEVVEAPEIFRVYEESGTNIIATAEVYDIIVIKGKGFGKGVAPGDGDVVTGDALRYVALGDVYIRDAATSHDMEIYDWQDNEIKLGVPRAAKLVTTGENGFVKAGRQLVKVVTPYGEDSVNFTIAPHLDSVDPIRRPLGADLDISGAALGVEEALVSVVFQHIADDSPIGDPIEKLVRVEEALPGGIDGTGENDKLYTFEVPRELVPEGSTFPQYFNVTVRINGADSAPYAQKLEITGEGNHAPLAFDLIAPTNGAADVSHRPNFRWQQSTDEDPGDEVSYKLYIYQDGTALSNLVRTYPLDGEPLLTDTEFSLADVTLPLGEGQYYWKVVATDGEDNTTSVSTYSFTVTANSSADPDDKVIDDFEGSYVTDPGPLPNQVFPNENYYLWDIPNTSLVAKGWRQSTVIEEGIAAMLILAPEDDCGFGGQLKNHKDLGAYNSVSFWIKTEQTMHLTVQLEDSALQPWQSDPILVMGSENWQKKTVEIPAVIFDQNSGQLIPNPLNKESISKYGFGNSDEGVKTFTIDLMQATINVPPSRPDLLTPNNHKTLLNPILTWSKATDTDSADPVTYTLVYSTDQSFAADKTTYVTNGSLNIGDQVVEYTLSGAVPGTYYWYVLATDSDGASTKSFTRDFTVTAAPQITGIYDRRDNQIADAEVYDTIIIKGAYFGNIAVGAGLATPENGSYVSFSGTDAPALYVRDSAEDGSKIYDWKDDQITLGIPRRAKSVSPQAQENVFVDGGENVIRVVTPFGAAIQSLNVLPHIYSNGKTSENIITETANVVWGEELQISGTAFGPVGGGVRIVFTNVDDPNDAPYVDTTVTSKQLGDDPDGANGNDLISVNVPNTLQQQHAYLISVYKNAFTSAAFEDTIFVNGEGNHAPQAFDLISPSAPDNFYVSQQPTFRWTPAYDQDLGDTVHYVITIQNLDNGQSTTVSQINGQPITQTQLAVSDLGVNLPVGLSLWTAVAVDSAGAQVEGNPTYGQEFQVVAGLPAQGKVIDDFEGSFVADPGPLPNLVSNALVGDDDNYYTWERPGLPTATRGVLSGDTINTTTVMSLTAPKQFDGFGAYLGTVGRDYHNYNSVSFQIKTEQDLHMVVQLKDSTNSDPVDLQQLIIQGSPNWQKKTVAIPATVDSAHLTQYGFMARNDATELPATFSVDLLSAVINQAPSAPHITRPLLDERYVQDSLAITWDPSVDPDGGTVTYKVLYSTDPDLAKGVTFVPCGDRTSALIENLLSGTYYYWQVVATDSAGADSASEIRTAIAGNHAPGAFDLIWPTNGAGIANAIQISTRPTFGWLPAVDQDENDRVLYTLAISDSQGQVTTYPDLSETSFAISDVAGGALTPGETYTWTVSAHDQNGAHTSANQAFTFKVSTSDLPPQGKIIDDFEGSYVVDPGVVMPNPVGTDDDYNVWGAGTTAQRQTAEFAELHGIPCGITAMQLDNQVAYSGFNGQLKNVKNLSAYSNQPQYGAGYLQFSIKVADGTAANVKAQLEELANPTPGLDPRKFESASIHVAPSADWQLRAVPLPTANIDLANIAKYGVVYGDSAVKTLYVDMVGVIFNQVPAEPGINYPPTPADGAEVSNANSITISWNAVTDPDGGAPMTYTLQYAANDQFTSGVGYVECGTNTTADLTLANGPYFWRIISTDDEGADVVGTTHNFMVSGNQAPGAFSLENPANGGDAPTLPRFEWSPSSDIDGDLVHYTLTVKDSLNAEVYTTQTTDTSVSFAERGVTPLINQANYTWNVTADDLRGGTIKGSALDWSFSVDASLPADDAIIDNFEGSYVSYPFALETQFPASGSNYYNWSSTVAFVQDQERHEGNLAVRGTENVQYGGFGGVLQTPKNLTNYDAITFWVMADNDLQVTAQLKDANDGTSAHASPQLRVKKGNWQPITVQIAELSKVGIGVNEHELDKANVTQYGFGIANSDVPQNFYVDYVTATNHTGPAAFNLAAPANNASIASGTPVTFSWNARAGVTNYTLAYTLAGGTTTYVDNITTTSHTVTLADGAYTWQVIAMDAVGAQRVSTETNWQFAVGGVANHAPSAFTQTRPAALATNVSTQPRFEWTRSNDEDTTDVVTYRLQVIQEGDNFDTDSIIDATTTDTSLSLAERNLPALVAGRDYQWRVTATDGKAVTTATNQGILFSVGTNTTPDDAILDDFEGSYVSYPYLMEDPFPASGRNYYNWNSMTAFIQDSIRHEGDMGVRGTETVQYGGFGGVLQMPKNLTNFNAITFWVMADNDLQMTAQLKDAADGNSAHASAQMRVKAGTWQPITVSIAELSKVNNTDLNKANVTQYGFGVANSNVPQNFYVDYATATNHTGPAAFNLTAPANNASIASGTPVTFSWNASAGATNYTLAYTLAGGTTTYVDNITTTSHTVTLADGAYTWQVIAMDAVGAQRVSAETNWQFTITPPVGEPVITGVLKARAGIVNPDPTRPSDWEPIGDGAEVYTTILLLGTNLGAPANGQGDVSPYSLTLGNTVIRDDRPNYDGLEIYSWTNTYVTFGIPRRDANNHYVEAGNKTIFINNAGGSYDINILIKPKIDHLSSYRGNSDTTFDVYGFAFGTSANVAFDGSGISYLVTHQPGTDQDGRGGLDLITAVDVPAIAEIDHAVTVVSGNAVSNAMTFTIVAHNQPVIQRITPDIGHRGHPIYATIIGSGFEQGAAVRLTRAGQTDITATDVVVSGSNTITCTLPLADTTAIGRWSVVVANGAVSDTLADAFYVTDELLYGKFIDSFELQGYTVRPGANDNLGDGDDGYSLDGLGFTSDNRNLVRTNDGQEGLYSGTITHGVSEQYYRIYSGSLATMVDLSAFDRVELTVRGDGSAHTMRIQLQDLSGKTFFASGTVPLSGGAWQKYVFNTADFREYTETDASGNPIPGDADMDTAYITGYQLVITGAEANLTDGIKVDFIRAYKNGIQPPATDATVPQNLMATKSGNDVVLTWATPAQELPNGYNVYFGTDPAQITTLLGNVPSGTHTITHISAVSDANSYYYVARGVSGAQESANSNIAYLLKQPFEYNDQAMGNKHWISVPYVNSYSYGLDIIRDLNGSLDTQGSVTDLVRWNPEINPETGLQRGYETLTHHPILGWISSVDNPETPDVESFPIVKGEGFEVNLGQAGNLILAGAHDPEFKFNFAANDINAGNKHWISIPYHYSYGFGLDIINDANNGLDAQGPISDMARWNPTISQALNQQKGYETLSRHPILGWISSEDNPNTPENESFSVVRGEGFEFSINMNLNWQPRTIQ